MIPMACRNGGKWRQNNRRRWVGQRLLRRKLGSTEVPVRVGALATGLVPCGW